MISLIEEKRSELEELCKAYSVKRLYLFGSAASGDFDQKKSDLDFLVAFHENLPPETIGRNMLALNEALEVMFQRKVDLIRERRFRNPVFEQAVHQSKEVILSSGFKLVNSTNSNN